MQPLDFLAAVGDADPNQPGIQHTLMSLFIQYIAPGLFTAIGGTLVAALLALRKKLGVEGETSKLAQASGWLADIAGAVLADVLSTLRPELQNAAADGRLTQGELASLAATALGRVKAIAGDKGLEWARGVLGVVDLDSYLRGIVIREAQILGARAAEGITAVDAAVAELRKPVTP